MQPPSEFGHDEERTCAANIRVRCFGLSASVLIVAMLHHQCIYRPNILMAANAATSQRIMHAPPPSLLSFWLHLVHAGSVCRKTWFWGFWGVVMHVWWWLQVGQQVMLLLHGG